MDDLASSLLTSFFQLRCKLVFFLYHNGQRRTREMEEGMSKMRFLRSLAQDAETELSPESPSPGIVNAFLSMHCVKLETVSHSFTDMQIDFLDQDNNKRDRGLCTH